MLGQLTNTYYLHPSVDHFTIALITSGIAAEVLAGAAILVARGQSDRLSQWSQNLAGTSLLLMIGGATAAVLSYLTGHAKADRLWDSMSPAAQHILASTDGAERYLSDAVLGQYLMYSFLLLAAWRVMIEFSARLSRWRIAYLMVAALAACILLYQGKTCGELVYEHGVGTSSGLRPGQSAEHL